MTCRISRSFIGTLTLAFLVCAFSTEHAESSIKGDPKTDPFWHRFMLFVGADGGYQYTSSDAAAELSKNGYQLDAKGLVSYSWKDVTVDGGGGWFYNYGVGNASGGTVLRDRLTMKAGFARLAGRYRFTPRWEAGLLNHILFGADTRFQTTLAAEKNVNWLTGVEAVYRIPFKFPVQLSGAFLTDVTIPDRQVYQFLFGVQVGFPFLTYPKEATPTPTPTPTPAPTAVPSPTPTVAPPVTVIIRTYSFDLQRIQFDFNKADIRPVSMPMLQELGGFLAQHPDAWDKLTVEGHTDNRGTAAYNQGLSERRAENVRKVLIAQGVKESSVTSVGYGLSKPLLRENTREARRQNRRVEFKVEGIHKPDLVDEFFRKLNRKY